MISCILIASGRLHQLQESLASWLQQDYADRELLLINAVQRQTIVGNWPGVTIYNVKEQALPMKLKTYAMGLAKGNILMTWDESAVYIPGFLSQVVDAIGGKEWVMFEHEFCFQANQRMVKQAGSEFSFAFTKAAFAKCGPYPPGIQGASDRQLMGRVTSSCPGERVNNEQINLIRMGMAEERERVGPAIDSGIIKLQPKLNRDYGALVEMAKTGKRANRLCIVSLGRYGDLINILPCLRRIHDLYETPHLMVSSEFADLLEGVSYVKLFKTGLKNEKLGEALAIAKQDFQIVVCAGVWGDGYQQKKCTPSYGQDAWNNLGMRHLFGDANLRPMFDQRDAERERILLVGCRGYDDRPMILVNVSKGVSSPCPHCAALLDEIRQVWGGDYNVVNLAEIRAHRLYDFIGVFEAAACLVSIDTSFLHLVVATHLPTVAICNARTSGWAATQVRGGNAVNEISYDEVKAGNRQMLHESIAAALQRPNKPVVHHPAAPRVTRKVYHIVDRFDEDDAQALSRKAKCQDSWNILYETGQLIPAHCWDYPRNARDVLGDTRPLPFLKDLLKHGMDQCGPDDILFFSNDDNILHPDLPAYLQYHLSVLGPCSLFRTEFRSGVPSLELPFEFFGKRSTERHIGRDGFAFTKRWLEENWDLVPSAVLGCKMWDVHLAILIRMHYGIKTTNGNIWDQLLPAETPKGLIAHIAHQSAWNVPQNDSAGNKLNGQLFLEFTKKYCPELKVTPDGNLA